MSSRHSWNTAPRTARILFPSRSLQGRRLCGCLPVPIPVPTGSPQPPPSTPGSSACPGPGCPRPGTHSQLSFGISAHREVLGILARELFSMYLRGGDRDKRGHGAAQDASRGLSAGARPPRRAAAHSSARGELGAGGTSSTLLAAPAPRVLVVVPAEVQPLRPGAKCWCTHLNQGAELHSPPLGCGGTDMGCA